MATPSKTKKELLEENHLLRQRIEELEHSESKYEETAEELRKSEQRIRVLFDQSLQFIGILELDGTLVEANKTAMKFAGINKTDCLGKYFWDTPWWTHSTELQHKLR